MNVRPLYNTNALFAWANKLAAESKANTVSSGKGVNVRNTPNGSVVSIPSAMQNNEFRYDYDGYIPTASYYKGTICRITSSYTVTWNSSSITIPEGTYVAVADVPQYFSPSDKQTIINSLPAELTGSISSSLRRDNWVYEPLYPEPIRTVEDYVETTSADITLNQPRFWEKVGGSSATTSVPTPKYFAIETLSNADYFKAIPLTIVGSGSYTTCSFATSSIYVAKHNFMRASVTSEWIDGVTISYSSYTDNSRTAASASYSEVQVTYPRYYTLTNLSLTGSNYTTGSVISGSSATALLNKWCIVKAAYVENSGLAVGTNKVQWEEIGTRVWARRKIQ